jgi:ABC-type Fe3+ transport system permease subunit
MPGIIGGALMAFTLSLDDYLITAFTKGVQEQTMPLYIYSLVRKGVTPEINALSTALLVGSIGLVGLSLTAQNGGAVYTKAMAFGAGLGFGLFGLINLPFVFTAFTLGGLVVNLLLLAGFYWAWRTFPSFKEELNETNRSGKTLAWIAVVVVIAAVYLSVFLLLA